METKVHIPAPTQKLLVQLQFQNVCVNRKRLEKTSSKLIKSILEIHGYLLQLYLVSLCVVYWYFVKRN